MVENRCEHLYWRKQIHKSCISVAEIALMVLRRFSER
jgi:hypothetical protein